MTINAYTLNELAAMVRISKPASRFARSSFFNTTKVSGAEFVHFDVKKGKRRVAPFVAPHVKGKVVEALGYETKTIVPAYIKDLRVITPKNTATRAFGEALTGELSRQQRMDLLTAEALVDMQEMIDRRIELMCWEILRTGAVVIEGDDYPIATLTFGRDSGLSAAASQAFGAYDDGEDPLLQIKEMASLCKKLSGRYPRNLIMSQAAFDELTLTATVQKKLDNRGVIGNQISTASNDEVGATFQGILDGFRLWTFEDWYVDANGTEQSVLPADEVLGVADVGGTVFFGAIEDIDAGLQPLPFFAKSWLDNDPSGLHLLGQSAPVPAATVPDGCFRLTGCTTVASS